MTYKYLFGPVPSRRLGMSLGVDIIPKKVCSLDCVYCEVGGTTKLTTQRMEYIPYEKVIAEIDDFMAHSPLPDYFTFSGSGEPTLNNRFGDVLNYIKNNYPHVKVAVLTNGTLLNDPQVRHEMMNADLVMPSLDAATTANFKKINRPAEGIKIKDYIEGIAQFGKEFKGEFNLEILFLKNYNHSREELLKLKEAILKINPSHVQLNTLDRPGVLQNLEPLDRNQLRDIVDFWQLPNIEIIAKAPERKHNKAYMKDKESAILQTINRRPCTLDDLTQLLGLNVSEVNKYLDVLNAEGKIEAVEESRGVFYKITK